MTILTWNDLFKDSVPKCSHILRLGLQYMNEGVGDVGQPMTVGIMDSSMLGSLMFFMSHVGIFSAETGVIVT